MDAQLVVRNLRQFRAEMKRADETRRKAGETAVKVEAYRLMLEMRKELRAGKAGNTTLAPLREVSRRSARSKPLAALARNAVRYDASGHGADFRASVGFLAAKVSGSWLRIAERQQAGFTVPADSTLPGGRASIRLAFARRGARLGKGSRRRKYFFLRRSTRVLTTPARPVIEPFWAAHEREAERNIINNFERKLAGERI